MVRKFWRLVFERLKNRLRIFLSIWSLLSRLLGLKFTLILFVAITKWLQFIRCSFFISLSFFVDNFQAKILKIDFRLKFVNLLSRYWNFDLKKAHNFYWKMGDCIRLLVAITSFFNRFLARDLMIELFSALFEQVKPISKTTSCNISEIDPDFPLVF